MSTRNTSTRGRKSTITEGFKKKVLSRAKKGHNMAKIAEDLNVSRYLVVAAYKAAGGAALPSGRPAKVVRRAKAKSKAPRATRRAHAKPSRSYSVRQLKSMSLTELSAARDQIKKRVSARREDISKEILALQSELG